MDVPHRPSTMDIGAEILDAKFGEYMESVMEKFHIPGASIAVVHGDKIEAKGYGMTHLDGPAATEDTLFNAASMSKSFTAAAFGLLVDDKENYSNVTWDTPVSKLMREDFVLSDAYATEHATAVDVLSHRTGCFGYEHCSHGTESQTPDTPRSITRKLRHMPMQYPFRIAFQYNNQMYTAASYLVGHLTSQPFYDFLKSRFWDPLGMTRTFGGTSALPEGYNSTPQDPHKWSDGVNHALPYFWDEKAESYRAIKFFDGPEGQGAGNILSTAPDFAKWLQSMMNGSNALSTNTIKELTTPRILASNNEDNIPSQREPFHSPQFYGMGWEIEYYRGQKVVHHSGGVPGYTSLMRYLPEKKLGIVLFGNSGGMSDASEVIAWKIIDDFLGVREEDRMDWVARMTAPDEEKEEDEPFAGRIAGKKLPLPMELKEFEGVYENAAFGEFEFKIDEEKGQLVADARDRTFGFWMRLEHVSGLYFVSHFEDPVEDDDSKCEAEFRVRADGKVEKLGVDFADEKSSELIWLKRVGD